MDPSLQKLIILNFEKKNAAHEQLLVWLSRHSAFRSPLLPFITFSVDGFGCVSLFVSTPYHLRSSSVNSFRLNNAACVYIGSVETTMRFSGRTACLANTCSHETRFVLYCSMCSSRQDVDVWSWTLNIRLRKAFHELCYIAQVHWCLLRLFQLVN